MVASRSMTVIIDLHRCTASYQNLDGYQASHQTCEFTELLLDTLDQKWLWEEYGVNDDILVSVHLLGSLFFYTDVFSPALHS